MKVQIDVDEVWPVYFVRDDDLYDPESIVEIPDEMVEHYRNVQLMYDEMQRSLKEIHERIQSSKSEIA